MKKLLLKTTNDKTHWVGDGFPVRSIFNYLDLGQKISPFLLMDYAGPAHFDPTEKKRGVAEHPHRGFETVTIVYAGEVEHRDSSGGGGLIKSGDVQWMTAGSGLVHEEFHGKEFSKKGGAFQMVQLWVNLPSKFKMTAPRYQGILEKDIPSIILPDESGHLRIIAGHFAETKGAALTFSPINLWDILAKKEKTITLEVPDGHSCSLFILSGSITTPDGEILKEAELALFENTGTQISFTVTEEAKILYLGGEIINEQIVGYGPFVMNTKEEIRQAVYDYQNGKMGSL